MVDSRYRRKSVTNGKAASPGKGRDAASRSAGPASVSLFAKESRDVVFIDTAVGQRLHLRRAVALAEYRRRLRHGVVVWRRARHRRVVRGLVVGAGLLRHHQ